MDKVWIHQSLQGNQSKLLRRSVKEEEEDEEDNDNDRY